MLALLVIFVALVALQRVLELILSRRHERILRVKGAHEQGASHYPAIVGLHAGWLVSMLLEGWVRGAELSALWPFWLALFVGGQTLRYWAILSLGERWTTRVIVLRRAPLVERGPYKYVRHPNYLAVALELLSAPLIFGASFTALAFTLLNAAVLWVRIRTEASAARGVGLPPRAHPALEEAQPSAGCAAVPAQYKGETRFASSEQTDCCIVGGGPAGVVLGLLLARQDVSVTLLEARKDFDREFRGNTINPSVMEVMEELGLADRLLGLRHAEVSRFTVQAANGSAVFADFSRLKTRYPYMLMLPQARFLEFVAAEARKYPNFRLVMGARVNGLVEEDGVVRGVRYRRPDGNHEVRARLTVGADGRFSRIRRLAGLEPVKGSPPMDVFWFDLPREPGDPEEAGAVFRFGPGSLLVLMDHFEHWQVGYIIRKGGYERLRSAGLPALRRSAAELAPELADRVEHLQDWKQGSLLSVESDRLRRWHRPGLLLIGDAAHVSSPVGGVGINLAIQDAVVAANALGEPLETGRRLHVRDLRSVQRRREWPTRLVQGAQHLAQRWVVSGGLGASETSYRLPVSLRLLLRAPVSRDLFARLIAFGAWRVRPETEVRANTNPKEVSLRRCAERTTRLNQTDAAHIRHGETR